MQADMHPKTLQTQKKNVRYLSGQRNSFDEKLMDGSMDECQGGVQCGGLFEIEEG